MNTKTDLIQRTMDLLLSTKPKANDQTPDPVDVVPSDLPFKVGDTVTYRTPGPGTWPAWTEHTGTVQAIDRTYEMVLIIPETEAGTEWRWVAWCYVTKQVTHEK